MNNWNRKVWKLNGRAATDPFADQVFNTTVGAPNEFWLEPSVYPGPDVTVGTTDYLENSLCYRVVFADGSMSDVWRDLYLIATGEDPLLGLDDDGEPDLTGETERLVGHTTAVNADGDDTDATMTLCILSGAAEGSELYVGLAEESGGAGGDDGWATGRQK